MVAETIYSIEEGVAQGGGYIPLPLMSTVMRRTRFRGSIVSCRVGMAVDGWRSNYRLANDLILNISLFERYRVRRRLAAAGRQAGSTSTLPRGTASTAAMRHGSLHIL